MVDLLLFTGFLILIIFPLGRIITSLFFPNSKNIFLPLSLSLGLLAITIEVYLLSMVGLFKYLVPIALLQSLIILVGLYKLNLRQKIRFNRSDLVLGIFIIFMVYVNSQLYSGYGYIKPGGLALYGAHFVDSTWHLSLIRSLTRSVPPENPLYSGVLLNNYHYLADLQIAITRLITSVPIEKLFFAYFGPLYLVLASVNLITLLISLGKSRFTALVALIFVFWSSNWYYLVSGIFKDGVHTPSIAWLEFFSSKVVNFPLLFSLSYIFAFLFILVSSPVFKDKKYYLPKILLGFFGGFLFAFKSHFGLVWLAALAGVQFVALFRKNLIFLPTFLTTFAVTAILAFSISSAGSSLEFNPFWFIKVMMESPDHFNYPEWELKRQTLLSLSAYLGVGKLYIQGLFWFSLINFGAFFIGTLVYFRNWKRQPLTDFEIILAGMFIAGFTATMFFVYRSTAIVTIQFIYLSLISLSILTAIVLGRLYRSRRLIALSIAVLIWFSLSPGVDHLITNYRTQKVSLTYGPDFVSLITFLNTLPPSTLLTDSSFNSGSAITAYTPHNVYLGDSEILQSLAIDSTSRRTDQANLLECKDTFLPVDYVIVTNKIPLEECTKLVKVFGNYSVYFNSNNPQSKLPN